MRIVVLLMLLMVSSDTFGQSNYAELSGTVLDPERAAIVGASIQLTSVSTLAERVGSSNEHGIFQIPGLLPGEYKLTVKAPGFCRRQSVTAARGWAAAKPQLNSQTGLRNKRR